MKDAINCRALREKLNDSLADGEVTAMDGDVALHLQACANCQTYYQKQVDLYRAIDSGVQKLVASSAPPLLLPGVHNRLSAAAPSRTWVQALVPSTVALLIVCGLLLTTDRREKVRNIPATGIPRTEHQEKLSSAPASEESNSEETESVTSNSRPTTAYDRNHKPVRPVIAEARVIVDQREAKGLERLAEAIRRDPEWAKAYLQSLEATAHQPQAIQPLNIAKLEISDLGEEKQ
jgi:hypothetical protein